MIRTPARKMSVAIVRRAIAEDAEVLGIIGPAAYAEAYGYLWDRPDAYSEQLRTFGARAPSKRILRLRANAGFFDMISYRRSASWGGVLVAGGEAGARAPADPRERKLDGRLRSPLSCAAWPTGSSDYNNTVAMNTRRCSRSCVD